MIKAVIFDFDNTLMDFMRMKEVAVKTAVDAMLDAGFDIPREKLKKEIYKIYRKDGIEDQKVLDKTMLKVLGKVDYKILAAGIVGYRRAKEGIMALYPHVHLTLAELMRMGIRMAVISDAPRLPVWMRIVTFHLHHYFDYVVSYEDTGERKPSPKPFKMALDLLKLPADQTLMVGDWLERDIAGAKKVGMKAVFAKYGDTKGDDKSVNPDYTINDIVELIDIIKLENK
jgi:putative hydrolase of the HAD superfamily